MLDDAMREFLGTATFAYVGTRDANNVPSGHRPFGQRVDSDGHLRVFFAERLANNIISNVEANGHMSFATAHVTTFEAYQLKGTYLHKGPLDEADHEALDSWREVTLKLCLQVGFPKEPLQAYLSMKPTVALTMKVTEMFDQTPGPGAGAAKGAS